MGDEFQIQIVSAADLTGFNQTSDASTRLQNETGNLNEEVKKTPGLWDTLKDKTKGLKEGFGDLGNELKESKHETREIGRELGNALGVADGGAIALGGMALAAVGVGKALEFLTETWKDVQEAISGPINVQINDDVAKVEASAKAWTQYADALSKARDAANSPDVQADNKIKQLETRLTLLKQILKAEEDEALASLAANKDKMSPQAYDAAVSRVKTAFGEKEEAATEDEQHDVISAKEKQAADLAKSAAEKKAKADGLAISPDSMSARGAVEANGEGAKKALEESEKNLAMINRIQRGREKGRDEVPEYQGLWGLGTAVQEQWDFDKRYGTDSSPEDARKIEETRKAQAEQQLAAAAQAKADTDKRNEERVRLSNEAAEEQAKSEALTREAGQMKQDFNDRAGTNQVTRALGAAGTALGQEHAAEGNNTPQGYIDAQAARSAAAKAVADLSSALKGVTDTHSEAYTAILKAIADLQAEDKKLAAKLAQTNFNNK